eukprot:TRINITY_DN1037_c0_g1_i1.p1 TRINITY_DN1037_c0_g1~~TRINITY_DN1037_c0_g1_i1.p1  ORF type:complete len:178 (-),score=34.00 TRINITY_DN1037_c0_g1_i1:40-573(-)
MESDRPTIMIAYGSQTGTAIEVAQDLQRLLQKRYFNTQFSSMNDIPISALPHYTIILFVCATSGQGDVPDNMATFWRNLLRRNIPNNYLRDVYYSVFSLGDSTYAKYNFAGKMLYKRVENIGAIPLCERGDGDDQHPCGLYGDFFPWCEMLFETLMTMYPLPPGTDIIGDDVLYVLV